MVKTYSCPRCGFQTSIKTHLKRHLYRKNPCIDVSGGWDMEYLQDSLNYGNLKMFYTQVTPIDSSNESKMTPIDSEMTHNESKMTPVDSKMTPHNNNQYNCKFCGTSLCKNSNLHRHMRTCKSNPFNLQYNHETAICHLNNMKQFNTTDVVHILSKKINDLQKQLDEKDELFAEQLAEKAEQLAEKDKQIAEKDKQINQLIPNQGSYNNNIILVNFGNETFDHIDYKEIQRMIKDQGVYNAFPEIFEQIYFNDKAPQNKTMKIQNLHDTNKLSVHKNGKWVTQDKKLVLDKAITKTASLAQTSHLKCVENMITDYQDNIPHVVKRLETDSYNVIETFHRNKKNK